MKRRRLLSIVLMMIAVLVMSLNAQAAVKINKKKATLIKGQSVTLKISGTKGKVKWSTNKKKVATVTQKGIVKARAKGTATISAKVGKKTFKCKVRVETPKISRTKATMNVGQKLTLKITGNTQKVRWSSNKKSITAVTRKGVVTAKKAGSAVITATIGKKKYKCRVTVKTKKNNTSVVVTPSIIPSESAIVDNNGNDTNETKETEVPKKPITSVTFDKTQIELLVGSSDVLQLSYLPMDTTDEINISWSSANNAVATVANGIVQGKSGGETTIYASVSGKTASCKVRVDYTESEKWAGAFLQYLDATLKNPDSLNVRNIWEAYNDGTNPSTGESYHNEFLVVEYSASNSFGGTIRNFAYIVETDEPRSFADINFIYNNVYYFGFEEEMMPTHCTVRQSVNIENAFAAGRALKRLGNTSFSSL